MPGIPTRNRMLMIFVVPSRLIRVNALNVFIEDGLMAAISGAFTIAPFTTNALYLQSLSTPSMAALSSVFILITPLPLLPVIWFENTTPCFAIKSFVDCGSASLSATIH